MGRSVGSLASTCLGPTAEVIVRKLAARKDPPVHASEFAGPIPIFQRNSGGDAAADEATASSGTFNGAPDPTVDINERLA
jgi:hypothetical protein